MRDPSSSSDPAHTPSRHHHREDEAAALFAGLLNKKKPFFEERWPKDSTRWRDKATDEKFAFVLKGFFLLALAAMFIHALIAGENSIWYYCMNGEWSSGINLYSVTICLITVCLLLVAKLFLHKLFYLLARATSAKGETICHLPDSFSGYALLIIGIFLCLGHIGVSTMALSLTGGVAGVVFGIGCQSVVADILTGILMTFEGVVHVGDLVTFNGQYGIVLRIGVRMTQFKSFGQVISIRNNDFKDFTIVPLSSDIRMTASVTIGMDETLENVEAIMRQALPVIHTRMVAALGDEIQGPTYMGVEKISDNGIRLLFAIYCKGRYLGWATRELNRQLKLMCEENGIRIALPQIVVHENEEIKEIKE